MAGEKPKGKLTRAQLVKNIKERLKSEYDIDTPKEVVSKVLEIEEDEIYMAIAKCLAVRYIWGTVYGIESPPKRVAGSWREVAVVKERHGWSKYKIGVPKIKWSQACKVCENHHPQEYFDMPEHRYTTLARQFRKESELPEIPEYEGLPEEKINEYCKKADEEELSHLNSVERYNISRDLKHNKQIKEALRSEWERTGYIPMGVIYDPILGDKNYTGEQKDIIDWYLNKELYKDENKLSLAEKYDTVLKVEDIGRQRRILDKHPEIEELKAKFKSEMDAKGIKPIPHKEVDETVRSFKLHFKGEEDPWGITAEMVKESKARRAKIQQEFQEDIKNLKKEQNIEQ